MTGDDGWAPGMFMFQEQAPNCRTQAGLSDCNMARKTFYDVNLSRGKRRHGCSGGKSRKTSTRSRLVCFDQLHNADAAQKSWIEIVPAASEMPPLPFTVFFDH